MSRWCNYYNIMSFACLYYNIILLICRCHLLEHSDRSHFCCHYDRIMLPQKAGIRCIMPVNSEAIKSRFVNH